MSLFSGLLPPKLEFGVEQGPIRTTLLSLVKFCNELLLKARRASGVGGTVTVVTDVRTNAGQLQKKSRDLTLIDGIITDTGTETDWTDAGAV